MKLDDIGIATPCPASWAEMKGDERKRRCDLCRLSVYNFAGMTRAEVGLLLEKSEGRVCARLYRRKDGTILTADCPVGLKAALRKRLSWAAAGIACAAAVMIYGASALAGTGHFSWARLAKLQPFKSIAAWFEPERPQRPTLGIMVMPPSVPGRK